jgi:predicted porin
MQKKVLAVAVAGALGAPALAFAQAAGTSTVQIFGTIYAEFDYYRTTPSAGGTGTTVTGPDRVNFDYFRTAGSEVGFKGEEQLGGGLAAWFQCAQSADIRGASSGAAGGFGAWCSRNSAIGLKGFFGNVYAGKWDTPYKRTYAIGNVASGESGGFGNAIVLNNGSTEPLQASAAASGSTFAASRGIFSRRESNSIFYDSPNFAGFQVLSHLQFANGSTNVTSGSTNTKPRSWGLAGQYNAGPLAVGLFYEKHEDAGVFSGAGLIGGTLPTAAGGTQQMEDRSYGISAAYTIGPVKLGAVYKREKYDVPQFAGAGVAPGEGEQRVDAWHLGVDWNIAGPHGLRAAYTRSGNVKGDCMTTTAGAGCAGGGFLAPTATGYRPGVGFRPDAGSGTSASMWQVKYVFAFSKRTEMQFGYSRINNSANAGYTYSDIGTSGTAAAGPSANGAPGKDPSAWVLTMQHKF